MDNHEAEANAHSKTRDPPNNTIALVPKADASSYVLPSHDLMDTPSRDSFTVQVHLNHRSVSQGLTAEGALTRDARIDPECEIVNAIKSPYCNADQCANRLGVTCRRTSEVRCIGLGMTWRTNKDVCQDCSCRFRMAPLSIESRISEECEVVNSIGSRYCRPEDCIKRGDVLCTKTPYRTPYRCAGMGLMLAHNQDVCKQCSCRLKLRRPPRGVGDTPPKRRKHFQRETHSDGTGRRTTVHIQRREVEKSCKIYHAFNSRSCSSTQCGQLPGSSCSRSGRDGRHGRGYNIGDPKYRDMGLAKTEWENICNLSLSSKMPRVMCARRSSRKFVGNGVRDYRKFHVYRGHEFRNGIALAPRSTDNNALSIWRPTKPKDLGLADYGGFTNTRREVTDGCEIFHAFKSRDCDVSLCGKIADCRKDGVNRQRCRGSFFDSPSAKSCWGCGCRVKGQGARALPYDLESARTTDECEIANPRHVPTCNPRLCAKIPEVSCKETLGSGSKCEGSGIRYADRNVCKGCRCRNRSRRRGRKQIVPKVIATQSSSVSWPSILEALESKDHGYMQHMRREVRFPCGITNPKGARTCNPVMCGKRWDVYCIPSANGLSCLGTGLKVKENRDVCRGCKCNMQQESAEKKPASAYGHHKNRELESTGYSEKILGREAALIQRREVREPCQIVNPSPRLLKTCDPLSCAQRWNVHCAKWSRYDPCLVGMINTNGSRPRSKSRLRGNRCIGAGMRDPVNADVCKGCQCRLRPGTRDNQDTTSHEIATPSAPPTKRRKSGMPAELPTSESTLYYKSALDSELVENQPRWVADGCEIYNAHGFATCNPLACSRQHFVICNKERHRCVGLGLDYPAYRNICTGCGCRKTPAAPKRRLRLPG